MISDRVLVKCEGSLIKRTIKKKPLIIPFTRSMLTHASTMVHIVFNGY